MEKESYMKKYRQYLSQINETNENINMLFEEYKKEYAKFNPGDEVIYKGKDAVIEDYSVLNDMSRIIYTVKTGKTLNYSIEEKDIKIKNKDMKHVEIEELIEEAYKILIALDYDVQIKNENYIYKIIFHVNDGSDSFPVRYVDMLRMLFKGFLHEFYYSSDTQIIIVRKENFGLEPDNDKYSCLLNEICRVSDNDKNEIFVNKNEYFERIILNNNGK